MKRLQIDPKLKELLSFTINQDEESSPKQGFLEKTSLRKMATLPFSSTNLEIQGDNDDEFSKIEKICMAKSNLNGPVLSIQDVRKARLES
jgi:hypothetical protein